MTNTQQVNYSRTIDEIKQLIVKYMKKGNIPGLSIALIDDDRVVWTEGFGHTDQTKTCKITPDTLFGIQSTSKTYTATAFLRAVHKGLVNLDDPLTKYYPEFSIKSRFSNDEVKKITFRQLLSHYAGLPHEAPIGNNYDDGECTFEEHIRSISDTWLKYSVGTRFCYSNLGLDLIAYVLERITGKKFKEYVKDELFEPIGMKSSVVGTPDALKNPLLAKGHEGSIEVEITRNIPMIGAAGFYCSVRDMAKFIAFQLREGKINQKILINKKLLNELTSIQYPEKGQTVGTGLSVLIVENAFGGTKFLTYSGGGFGYACDQAWLPKYNIGVAILTNQRWHDDLHLTIERRALSLMISEKTQKSYPFLSIINPSPKPEVKLDTVLLQRLEGGYSNMGACYRFKVLNKEPKLIMGTTIMNLRVHSSTEFSTENGVFIAFELDFEKKPKVMKLIYPYGRFIYYDFVDPQNIEFGSNKSEWKRYMGIYRAKHYSQWPYTSVWIEKGHLYVKYFEVNYLLEEHENGLFLSFDNLSVSFKDRWLILDNALYEKVDKSAITELWNFELPHILLAAPVLQNLAVNLFQIGCIEKALEVCELLSKTYNKDVNGFLDLSICSIVKNDFETANYCIKRVLELNPNHSQALEIRKYLIKIS
ncbi:MAG: serine hydrolase [Promethearchaeota archaeon]